MTIFRFKAVRSGTHEIDYETADKVSRKVTLADISVSDGNQVKIAAAYQALIQAEIDTEMLQSDLPPDDPERQWKASDFEAGYPKGNRYLERRGSNLFIVERPEVVSITWDEVYNAYRVKVSINGV